MNQLFGREFIQTIKRINPAAKSVAGDSEILCRCPFCGDSKDPRHAHFYISVPQEHDELSFYHCKKCPSRGIVGEELLRKFGCMDSSVLVQISKHNSDILKLPKYKTLKKINVYPLKNNYIRKCNWNQEKLNYINNRIGSCFTFGDLINLKIVLNLYDIINLNRLELTRYESICKSLDQYFIGFISYDNAFVNMRKMTDKELYKSINKRYINYNLVNKLDNSKNYYIIPTEIDVLNPAPVKIHIAEGPFDILSIYYNLNQCNRYQNIYMSCGGKGYLNSLEFLLTEFGLINYEIHFYPDKDVSDYEFRYVMNATFLLNSNMFIHRNIYEGEKDYGVPVNKIKDSISQRLIT